MSDRLSDKTCTVCECPPDHKSHMLPTYREHNYDPACCVEYLLTKIKRLNAELRNICDGSGAVVSERCLFGWEGDARCAEDPDVPLEDYCVLCAQRETANRGEEVTG